MKRFLAIALCGSALIGGLAQADNYDVVILNGRVMDPETNFDAVRNVGIKNGRIETITEETIFDPQLDKFVTKEEFLKFQKEEPGRRAGAICSSYGQELVENLHYQDKSADYRY